MDLSVRRFCMPVTLITWLWSAPQVMHTSGEDEAYVTRAQLTRTRRALRLLHGGLSALLAAAGGDRGVLRRRLWRTLAPLLAAAAGSPPPLERVLDVRPRLDWAQVCSGWPEMAG